MGRSRNLAVVPRVLGSRRLPTGAVTLALLATIVGQALSSPVPARAATTPPSIDLANPTATVRDPIAGLAPVNTECADGQVDLNTASVAELSSGLHLSSKPTIERLVAMRPWLKGSDLSSVPGIGPDVAARLAPKTCTTQHVLPAATPLACTSSSQVDLQAASAADIATRLKLPDVTANDIVAARPLPQDLGQVITPRVRGLARPRLAALLDNGQICVTPAPMFAGGAAWRWGTAAGGVVVRRDHFGLIVPPGRIISVVGAWVSVTPLEPQDGVLPRMDGHIWGPWDSGSTTVAVQGPWSSDGEPTARPVVVHAAAEGDKESVGGGIALSSVDGTPTATALQYSLSTSAFGTAECGTSVPSGLTPFCLSDLTDGFLAGQWNEQALRFGSVVSASIDEKPSCGTLGTNPMSVTLGHLPFGIICALSQENGTGSWELTDEATNSLLGVHLDVVYHYDVYPDGTNDHHVNGEGDANLWVDALRTAINHNTNFLLGKQTLTVNKLPDSGETTVEIHADPLASGLWAVVPSLVELVGRGLGAKLYAAAGAIEGCAPLLNSHNFTQLADCVKTATKNAVDAYLREHPVENNKPSFLQKVAATVKFAVKALDIASFAGSFAFALGTNFGDGQAIVLRNNRPPAPGTGGGGGVNPGDSFIARDPSSRRAVLVKPNGAVRNIPDGGVFNCLASTWVVWDNPNMPQLNAVNPAAATCADAGPAHWDFRPVSHGGNIPNNVLLRERPEDATNGVIASYLINNLGEIQTITGATSGGIYLCLAQTNPVIWNVPFGFGSTVGIQDWPEVGHEDASCGPG